MRQAVWWERIGPIYRYRKVDRKSFVTASKQVKPSLQSQSESGPVSHFLDMISLY